MPEDKRLYMTFPIDMHRHPKVARLAVAIRWTFFEMNGEARIADNDGVFSEAEAEYMWPKKHLDALVASHPERPLVRHEDGCYIIRDYAQHQLTREAREKAAEISRANGAKGGRPKNNPEEPGPNPEKPSQVNSETQKNPEVTQPKANGTQTKPESESESELEPSDITNFDPVSYLGDAKPKRRPD